jgi:hypothetical protein
MAGEKATTPLSVLIRKGMGQFDAFKCNNVPAGTAPTYRPLSSPCVGPYLNPCLYPAARRYDTERLIVLCVSVVVG